MPVYGRHRVASPFQGGFFRLPADAERPGQAEEQRHTPVFSTISVDPNYRLFRLSNQTDYSVQTNGGRPYERPPLALLPRLRPCGMSARKVFGRGRRPRFHL